MYYNEPHKSITFLCPISLIKRVKIQCLKQGATLKDTITKLLIKWVAEQEGGE